MLNGYRAYRRWWREVELHRPVLAVLVAGISGAGGAMLGTAVASNALWTARVVWAAAGAFLGGAVGQSLRSRRVRRRAQNQDAASRNANGALDAWWHRLQGRRPLIACALVGLAAAWLTGMLAGNLAAMAGWSLPAVGQTGFAAVGFVAGCAWQRARSPRA